MLKAEWRPVEGFEGLYEVSDEGKVRSLDRVVKDKNGKRTRTFKGRELKDVCANTGYHHVSLHRNNERETRRQVQTLVAEAFLKESWFDGAQVDHIDGIRANNHVDNLRWVTPRENNLNTPYTRYLRGLLIQNNINFLDIKDFYNEY
jgi:hypothetical protein